LIKAIQAKTLLSHQSKPDPWFGCRYNMNLYRGCQHQCIYCDSRSECYRIENFKDILYKENAVDMLRQELSSKRQKGTIGFGAMNDAYMPLEQDKKLTRRALEVIREYDFPIHILTKSDLVLRDKDIIKDISKTYAAISFTITAADDELAAKIEPGAPASSKRFEAMRKLSDEGIYTGITMMPILPFINDTEENISDLLKKAADSGCKYIIPWFAMTLRDRQRTYYYEKLDKLFPGLRKKYIKTFGDSYECNSPRKSQLEEIFSSMCIELGINTRLDFYKSSQMVMGI
jgi:DNA repair photolyase